jgi:hypothetical protein
VGKNVEAMLVSVEEPTRRVALSLRRMTTDPLLQVGLLLSEYLEATAAGASRDFSTGWESAAVGPYWFQFCILQPIGYGYAC